RRAGEQQLYPRRIGTRQTVVARNLVTEPQQRPIEMEQASLAFGLHRALRALLLGPSPAVQRQPGEVELLIGSGVALVSHDGSLASRKYRGRSRLPSSRGLQRISL